MTGATTYLGYPRLHPRFLAKMVYMGTMSSGVSICKLQLTFWGRCGRLTVLKPGVVTDSRETTGRAWSCFPIPRCQTNWDPLELECRHRR